MLKAHAEKRGYWHKKEELKLMKRVCFQLNLNDSFEDIFLKWVPEWWPRMCKDRNNFLFAFHYWRCIVTEWILLYNNPDVKVGLSCLYFAYYSGNYTHYFFSTKYLIETGNNLQCLSLPFIYGIQFMTQVW